MISKDILNAIIDIDCDIDRLPKQGICNEKSFTEENIITYVKLDDVKNIIKKYIDFYRF